MSLIVEDDYWLETDSTISQKDGFNIAIGLFDKKGNIYEDSSYGTLTVH